MGCIGSRLVLLRNRTLEGRRNSHSGPNVFAVLNVDDMSRHISPGKLEVTETDLVLHLRGKPPLTWPLRCLRRYGYEEDLFSFESGRRCPTGAGIYAFKCNRAQSLFNLLQSKIQGSNPGNAPVPSTPITPNSTNMTSMSPTFDYVNITENSLARNCPEDLEGARIVSSHSHGPSKLCHQMSHPELDEGNHPVYMNIDGHSASAICTTKSSHIASDVSHQINVQFPGVHKAPHDWAGNRNLSNFSSQNISALNASVVYTNVDCSAGTPKRFSEINYAELDLQTDNLKNVSNLHSNFSSAKSKHLTFITGGNSSKTEKLESRFKNCELTGSRDIVASSSSGLTDDPRNISPKHTSSTSNHSELGYATIDFDRTAALSIVTRSKIKLDFSSCTNIEPPAPIPMKKNRNNSTAL